MCGFRKERKGNKIKEARFVTPAFLGIGTTIRTRVINSTPHKAQTILQLNVEHTDIKRSH
jgi:hypothetical protein